jgi:hypothetical protein
MPSQYDRMAHLIRRAGFGARPDEINNYLSQGFEATVDQLINYEQIPDPDVPAQPTTPNGGFDITLLGPDDIAAWWFDRMIKTKRRCRSEWLSSGTTTSRPRSAK